MREKERGKQRERDREGERQRGGGIRWSRKRKNEVFGDRKKRKMRKLKDEERKKGVKNRY